MWNRREAVGIPVGFLRMRDVLAMLWITDDGSIGTRRMLDLSVYDHNSLFDNATKWRLRNHYFHGGIGPKPAGANLTRSDLHLSPDEREGHATS